jgi:FkbM family methyltransferase
VNKYSWLLRFPNLYAWLSTRRNLVNYEKLLYLRAIRKGDVVFDIGANIGYYSILFSKLCGKNGFVHCFEPVPETFKLLLQALGNSENTKLNNLAAGNSEDTLEMSYDPEDSEKASLIFAPTSTSLTRIVKVLPLDAYAEEIKLDQLDFLKCDVEGFELKTLKGMVNTLSKYLPQLSLEITLAHEQRQELIELLMSLGYDSFRKIEKGFPNYDPTQDMKEQGDYFYLHATSSLAS